MTIPALRVRVYGFRVLGVQSLQGPMLLGLGFQFVYRRRVFGVSDVYGSGWWASSLGFRK